MSTVRSTWSARVGALSGYGGLVGLDRGSDCRVPASQAGRVRYLKLRRYFKKSLTPVESTKASAHESTNHFPKPDVFLGGDIGAGGGVSAMTGPGEGVQGGGRKGVLLGMGDTGPGAGKNGVSEGAGEINSDVGVGAGEEGKGEGEVKVFAGGEDGLAAGWGRAVVNNAPMARARKPVWTRRTMYEEGFKSSCGNSGCPFMVGLRLLKNEMQSFAKRDPVTGS